MPRLSNDSIQSFTTDEFEQDIEANYLQALLGFSGLLEEQLSLNVINSKVFMLLIREAVTHFGIGAQEFSKEFDVHASTVGRWVSGESFPSKMVRGVILSWVYEKIESAIASYIQGASATAIDRVDRRIAGKLGDLNIVQA